jgi:uroporphyrinogen-III decarboxylase
VNSKQRVLTALKLGKPDKVPFMELGIDYAMGQQLLKKDEYTPIELAKFLHLDGIGTGCYPNLYAKRETKGNRSHIVGGMIETRDNLSMIKLTDPKAPEMYENLKRYVEEYGKDLAIFGATNIGLDPVLLGMGLDNFSYALADDINLIEEILDIYVEWAAQVVVQMQKIGVDIVWFTDDIAFNTSLMFAPDFFREIAVPRLRKVMEEVKVPTIYHSDGNILPVIDDLIQLGINGLHPMDPCALDINEVKKNYGHKACLVGNIDLRHTLVTGTKEEVDSEVRDRIEKVGYNGGYIISSANTITDYCKAENVIAMRDAIDKYGCL